MENLEKMQMVLETKLKGLETSLQEVKVTLADLVSAVTRMALIEDRLANLQVSMLDYKTERDNVNKRLLDLERSQAMFNRTNLWVERVVWACVATVGVYVSFKVGLIK
jgi:chromosome segregation ATPase